MFEDIRKRVGRAVDDLRKSWTSTTSPAKDEKEPSSAKRRTSPSSKTQNRKDTWSYKRFYKMLKDYCTLGNNPSEMPDRIVLEPMAPIFRSLRQRSKGKNESGRVGIVDLIQDSLILEKPQFGTDQQVVLSFMTNARRRSALMMHTHPGAEYFSRTLEHLSPTDFKTLLGGNTMVASIVVTSGASLMVVRSDHVKGIPDEILFNRIDDCMRDAERMARDGADAGRIFTKMACIELGLFLYKIQPDEEPMIARKVLLFDS